MMLYPSKIIEMLVFYLSAWSLTIVVHPDTTKHQEVLTAAAEAKCAVSWSLEKGLQGKIGPVTPSCKAGLTKCCKPMIQMCLL